MITARQKKNENIVEYIIYMWQVEDLIRASHFNMEKIEECIISQYSQPENIKNEIRQWYQRLIERMQHEGVRENGHLRENKNIVDELTATHRKLLRLPGETVYGSLYTQTLPSIVQLRAKSGGKEMPEIETCLTAVYGYLLLKMQQKEISNETETSIKQISALLSFLAGKYHEEQANV